MKKINLIGSLFDSSGYSAHTKGLFQGLIELGADVRLEVPKIPGWEALVSDAELNAIMKPFDKERITIMISQPPFWRLALADNPKAFYGFVVWEGDKVPEYWLDHLLNVDGILVPSQHVKDAILKTSETNPFIYNLIKDSIHIIPHGVDLNLFKPSDIPKEGNFTFICNKGWSKGMNDRGGVQYVIKAFAEEFRKDELVDLKIKINPAYLYHGWNLGDELNKLNLPEDRRPILITTQYMTPKELVEFYQSGDVFVCATMGEAFNIPGLEAKACGLPTIQTGFGGQVDYMGGCDIKIDYELEEVTWDISYEGIKWARPKIDELRKSMRAVYEMSKSSVGKLNDARQDAEEFSWRNSAKKLLEAMK